MKGNRPRKRHAHRASVAHNRAKRRRVIAERRSGRLTPSAELRQAQPRHEHRGDVIRFGDWLHRVAA